MNPSWIAALIAMPDREEASIAFGNAFIAAPAAERAAVHAAWPFGVEWTWPSPWRLACTRGERGTPHERILASLVLIALDSREDYRENILMHATVYNSCRLAGLDADAIFSMVAAVLPGPAAASLEEFVAREPQDKAMGAFALETRLSVDGEVEIRPNW